MRRTPVDKQTRDDLARRFTYHPPKLEQPERYECIRAEALGMAITLCELAPDSRERALALTNLQQAVMWANAAIACNE
jgi:hypothetical protein